MKEKFDSQPQNIKCAIGPSICSECYEVSQDVYDEFSKVFSYSELSEIFTIKDNNKYNLDLHLACSITLLNEGVKKENIANPDFCTCCNPDFFFSHRASSGKRGNLAGVIMLK